MSEYPQYAIASVAPALDQTADTFIRDAEFTAGQNRLTGEGTFGDQTIRLVLTKSD